MKNAFNSKKCKLNPREKYIRKIKVFPSFLYFRLDRWLKNMSLKGWHIVHCGLFTFWFEKGEPEEKEYFTYGLATQEGKYSISLRYPLLEKTYGLAKKKSKINSNETKAYQIVEIDKAKLNSIGYKEMVDDRNRLYMRYFLRNFSIISAAILVLVALSCFS